MTVVLHPTHPESQASRAIAPQDEQRRLEELYSLDVLDTPPEAAYDDLVQMAATVCEAPISALNLIDATQTWSKAAFGLDGGYCSPRSESFCNRTIADPRQMLVIEDAREHPEWADLPSVTATPGVRAYAGAAIVSASGNALGALCVADTSPRCFADSELTILAALARQAASLLELRASNLRLAELNRQLAELSTIDHLTGLPNRRACGAALGRALAQVARGSGECGVVLADVDGLKYVNDNHGHAIGDVLLQATADRLRAATRAGDLACRLAGDEFVIICQGPGVEQGMARVVTRLATETRRPLALEGFASPLEPSVSFGFTIARPQDTAESVLARADEAMYAQKRGRRSS